MPNTDRLDHQHNSSGVGVCVGVSVGVVGRCVGVAVAMGVRVVYVAVGGACPNSVHMRYEPLGGVASMTHSASVLIESTQRRSTG